MRLADGLTWFWPTVEGARCELSRCRLLLGTPPAGSTDGARESHVDRPYHEWQVVDRHGWRTVAVCADCWQRAVESSRRGQRTVESSRRIAPPD